MFRLTNTPWERIKGDKRRGDASLQMTWERAIALAGEVKILWTSISKFPIDSLAISVFKERSPSRADALSH